MRLDVLLSQIFFYSQSRASNVLKDKWFSFFRSLNSNFTQVRGNIGTTPKIDENRLSKKNRSGNSRDFFASGYEIEPLPTEMSNIIDRHFDDIVAYLGKNFVHDKTAVWRNYSFPHEFLSHDIYSNVWHQDSDEGNRCLKIFLLVHDVDVSRGPFRFIEFKSVKKHWDKLRERYSVKNVRSLSKFDEEVLFCGKKGDYIIVDTSKCMHRASVPEQGKFRDIIQLSLYPSWRKTQQRFSYQ